MKVKNSDNKSSLLVKGSVFRLIQTIIGISIGFWMLPFLISHLGSKDYALWILVGSIVSSYYLMDLGLNHAVTRYVSKYIYSEKYERANQIINTAILIYSSLGAVLFILTILGALFIAPNLISSNVELKTAQAVILITGLSVSLEFPAKAFPGIIHAYMRFDTIALVRTISSIVNAILIYIFISNGYGIYTLAIIALTLNLLTTSFYIFFCFNLFSDLKLNKKYISTSDLKDIFHFSKWTFIIDMTGLVKQKMDIWLIAIFLSGGAITTYYAALRLAEYSKQFAAQALGFTVPIFTRYYAKNQLDKLEESLTFFLKLNTIALTMFVSGFFLVGDSFLALWIKDGIDHKLAYQCLIILATGKLLIFMTSPFASLLMTINQQKYSAYFSIMDTTAAGLLALLLIPEYGIIASAISFSLLVGVLRLIYLPYLISKFLNFNFTNFFIRISIYIVYAYLVSTVWYYSIEPNDSWFKIASTSILIALSILPGTLLLFSLKEKQEIKLWFKSKFEK